MSPMPAAHGTVRVLNPRGVEAREAGVGSKRTHPEPGKKSSGQACRLSELTIYSFGT